MQIRSDDSDNQFQALEYKQQQNQQNQQNLEVLKPTKSQIKYQQIRNIYKVIIELSQKRIDMNLLQNQYYTITILKQGKQDKQKIQRRYSDFDLLFQVLNRNYPGFIFPAFPQKGLVSYVKTKVTVVKDQSFSKNRIKMIERFLTSILNQQQFNIQKCNQIKKFFSNKQYDLFQKTQKQRNSSNIIDSTWSYMKNYFKLNSKSKYQPIIQQLREQKKQYQHIYIKTKQLCQSVNDEIKSNQQIYEKQWLMNNNNNNEMIPNVQQFKQLVIKLTMQLKKILDELEKLEFKMFCENQDYLMVFKKIQLFQEMKENKKQYKEMAIIENQFISNRHIMKIRKENFIKKFKDQFNKISKDLCEYQRKQ